MGVSVDGYPYPEGTDPVAQGDNTIKALATKLDGRTAKNGIASGASSVQTNGVNVSALITVTYPVGRFTGNPPSPFVQSGGTGWISTINYATLSTTSFQFTIKQTTGANGTGLVSCPWMALQCN